MIEKKRKEIVAIERKQKFNNTAHKQLINEHCTNSIQKISFQWRQGTNKHIHNIYIYDVHDIARKNNKRHCTNNSKKYINKERERERVSERETREVRRRQKKMMGLK